MKKKEPSLRPYTTDYGTTKGHCSTARRAVRAAIFRMEATGQYHTVIECPDGRVVDVWWNGFFGVSVQIRGAGQLRRVK
jgi:hypothetical protein